MPDRTRFWGGINWPTKNRNAPVSALITGPRAADHSSSRLQRRCLQRLFRLTASRNKQALCFGTSILLISHRLLSFSKDRVPRASRSPTRRCRPRRRGRIVEPPTLFPNREQKPAAEMNGARFSFQRQFRVTSSPPLSALSFQLMIPMQRSPSCCRWKAMTAATIWEGQEQKQKEKVMEDDARCEASARPSR